MSIQPIKPISPVKPVWPDRRRDPGDRQFDDLSPGENYDDEYEDERRAKQALRERGANFEFTEGRTSRK